MRNVRTRRYWWLSQMVLRNGYTTGAEIGCYHGVTTAYLLRHCPRLHLYAVDRWEKIMPSEDGRQIGCEDWDPIEGKKKFDRRVDPYAKRLTVLQGDSVEMAAMVPDESLDFVFVDADHRYEAVLGDIRAWIGKLKDTGTMCGHDFDHPRLPGVKQAVEESFYFYRKANVDWVWYAKKDDYVG